jgi:solute carrier family 8 (sodium/calcium exchanger)
MEYMAFRKCDNIAKKDLSMDTFISDRHSSIAKHFREKLPVVKHYFDLWHLVKSMCHQPIDWQ